ncbi:hypothetical protein ABKV19_017000 [Rosa sericea]
MVTTGLRKGVAAVEDKLQKGVTKRGCCHEISTDNKTVSIFETAIRVLGGLLSAHLIASDYATGMRIPTYDNQLLNLAEDLGRRLLPAFDTPSVLHSRRLIAAGAGIALIDSVVEESKNIRDPPTGFALIRPPRHHAIPKGPMGFCVFGNIAIAAHYAQRAHGLKGVFIIDFDVHHGNGTNDAFYEDPDIFFLSTHQKVVQRWPCLWNGIQ